MDAVSDLGACEFSLEDLGVDDLILGYVPPPTPRPVLVRRPTPSPRIGAEPILPTALAPVLAEPASQHVTLAAYIRGIDVHTALVVGVVALGLGLGLGWYFFGKAAVAGAAVAAL